MELLSLLRLTAPLKTAGHTLPSAKEELGYGLPGPNHWLPPGAGSLQHAKRKTGSVRPTQWLDGVLFSAPRADSIPGSLHKLPAPAAQIWVREYARQWKARPRLTPAHPAACNRHWRVATTATANTGPTGSAEGPKQCGTAAPPPPSVT